MYVHLKHDFFCNLLTADMTEDLLALTLHCGFPNAHTHTFRSVVV